MNAGEFSFDRPSSQLEASLCPAELPPEVTAMPILEGEYLDTLLPPYAVDVLLTSRTLCAPAASHSELDTEGNAPLSEGSVFSLFASSTLLDA